MELNKIYQGDVREVLKSFPDGSIQCCVTSPPYWGLRDYGTAKWVGGNPKCDHNPQQPDGGQRSDRSLPLGRGGLYRSVCAKCGAVREDAQIGLESTPEEYVQHMVEVFREVKRVLRNDGVLWLNLGDTILDKNLVGIPWRVAFALQADGWYLRSDVIWHKPNPMPESVTDRPTKAHEYIFLLTKSERYFYDNEAVKEPVAPSTVGRGPVDFGGAKGRNYKNAIQPDDPNYRGGSEQWGRTFNYEESCANGRNRRSVWTITTKPYKEAHFATFPPELPTVCIKAGTSEKGRCANCGAPWERVLERQRLKRTELPETDPRHRPHSYSGAYEDINGKGDAGYTDTRTVGWQPTCSCAAPVVPCVVLDPFAGSGTTLAVAESMGRNWVGVELNPKYVKLAMKRIGNQMRIEF